MGNLIIQDVFEPYYAGCRAVAPTKASARMPKSPRIAPASKPLSAGQRGKLVAVPKVKR